MIITEDLSKRFNDFLAVDGVNLHVNQGEVLALLGPNGAGKTTTVRMLTSVLSPSRGRAWVAGFDVVREAQKVRASVGVLTENHGLYNRMPAAEYLDFFGQVYELKPADRAARINRLLTDFGLFADRNRKVGEFSKGMRQKLALARAMLHNPPVLLLDEPTSAMDPESSRLVRNSIKQLRSDERAVIICTHNLNEAEELADRIAIIRHGKIIANGSPRELKYAFLGPPAYRVEFSGSLNGTTITLPEGVDQVSSGENWLVLHSNDPEAKNPEIIRSLVAQDRNLISFQEVNRSLEGVYLKAMGNHLAEGTSDVE
jgi:ABC-2 type transport system ATP-binding protein